MTKCRRDVEWRQASNTEETAQHSQRQQSMQTKSKMLFEKGLFDLSCTHRQPCVCHIQTVTSHWLTFISLILSCNKIKSLPTNVRVYLVCHWDACVCVSRLLSSQHYKCVTDVTVKKININSDLYLFKLSQITKEHWMLDSCMGIWVFFSITLSSLTLWTSRWRYCSSALNVSCAFKQEKEEAA